MRGLRLTGLALAASLVIGCDPSRITTQSRIVDLGAEAVSFSAAEGVNNGAGSVAELDNLSIGGSNRLLICVVSIEPRTSATTVSSAVVDDGFGGGAQALLQLGSYYSAPSDGLKWSTWYVTAPATGSGRRVLTTFTQPVVSWEMACDTYSGVNQATPFANVATASGTSGTAKLKLVLSQNGSIPWGHLFSTNAGYAAGPGVVNRQKSTTHPPGTEFSYLVDAGGPIARRDGYTFTWIYSGEFGGQGAMILPAGGDQ